MPTATFSTIINRVLDDLFRDDLTAQATTALQTAIRQYESYPWWPKEERAYTTTVDGQEYYALPLDFQKIDTLRINVGSAEYPLYQRTWEQIDLWQDSTSAYTGRPSDFCIFDEQLRLYPIPDGAYTMTMGYSARLADLAAGDNNAWTNHAEELVRRCAEADIAYSILRDVEAYQVFRGMESKAKAAVIREHTMRVMRGKGRKRR